MTNANIEVWIRLEQFIRKNLLLQAMLQQIYDDKYKNPGKLS